MARVRLFALLLLTILGLVAGCGKQQAPVDRTGTNAVAKSFFQDSSWYFGRTVVTMLVFAAIAIYGFAISVAGRPIFKDSVFDDPA